MHDRNREVIEADQPEVEAPPRGVAFFDLRHGKCNFPLGSVNDPPKWFCGEPALSGSRIAASAAALPT